MTETFVSYSLIAVYSAMAIYTLAFVMFAVDLARRSAESSDASAARATGLASASAQQASVMVNGSSVGGTDTLTTAGASESKIVAHSPKSLKLAMAMTVLAWVLHVGAVIFRGVAANRVPWANMFEFTLTATALIVGVFLIVQFWQDLRFLGSFITGFVLIALGVGTSSFYVDVVPLPPALQSAWLVIHVFVASLSTGFFALAASLSIVQLMQARREAGKALKLRFLDTLPAADRLETLAYRLTVVGFVMWTFTLIAGAVWAERAWGRYWGWDTKEVWTFIIWTLYAGYIHARATRGWRGSRSAWLAIVGFLAIVFNFTVVNLFFKGLHAYSGL
ncbi:cytochrome c-type biogenesis protein CcsB [Salinibacterium amurskyense]|uniref:Cytochrome c-type biogenesis protein CcsB n=1 Tax=Salinibacterium amurskyense TaxID=205941 RepID=A0A2M9D2Q3_9MICO|nr:c-type cytochrome biogenesis protein CcsB [Salinibacterium amurskyense]PJJ78333.1 cytochrome c-type biogenesis protein CcsB [Salinibacterium amurskyense]GHD83433.1 c-type cytochrome biogenesis protein CcsB [Salinibacterium amurskyense]